MKKIYTPPKTEMILMVEELQPIAASPTGSAPDVTPGEGGGGNGTVPPVFNAKSTSPHSSRPFFDDDYPDNAEEMYE